MDVARLFVEGNCIIVRACDVENMNLNPYDTQFIDIEEKLRAYYVKKSKNGHKAHFKSYLSREDYQRLSPVQKTRYEILMKKRHDRESRWHKHFKDLFKEYAILEKQMKDEKTDEYKIYDAFIESINTVLEFQHSYIAGAFENRSEFYVRNHRNLIWVCDCKNHEVIEEKRGFFTILEDNSKGFFRIAEDNSNLEKYPVFIQAKNNLIYRVKYLYRKEIDGPLKSTIRYFKNEGVYTEEEFVKAVLSGTFKIFKDIKKVPSYKIIKKPSGIHSLNYFWHKNYKWMIVRDTTITDKDNTYIINRNRDGNIFKFSGYVTYKYVTYKGNHNFSYNSYSDYLLKSDYETYNRFEFLCALTLDGDYVE